MIMDEPAARWIPLAEHAIYSDSARWSPAQSAIYISRLSFHPFLRPDRHVRGAASWRRGTHEAHGSWAANMRLCSPCRPSITRREVTHERGEIRLPSA